MAAEEKSNSPIAVEREDRILRIALNQPENRNRLTPILMRRLLAALGEAESDPGVRCIVIEQRGEVFCGGIDYEALSAEAPSGVAQRCEESGADPAGVRVAQECEALLKRLFSIGRLLRKPAVAAVRGACAGAGIGLMLQCHYALAAQGTRFAVTEIHSGRWPSLYYDLLVRAAGPRRARELALTGRMFSAADAQSYGLVDEITPAFELEERAMQMAAGLASLNPAAVAAGLAEGERLG